MASSLPFTMLPAKKPQKAHSRSFHWCSKRSPPLKAVDGRKSNAPSSGRSRRSPVTIPPNVVSPSRRSCWSDTTAYSVCGSTWNSPTWPESSKSARPDSLPVTAARTPRDSPEVVRPESFAAPGLAAVRLEGFTLARDVGLVFSDRMRERSGAFVDAVRATYAASAAGHRKTR